MQLAELVAGKECLWRPGKDAAAQMQTSDVRERWSMYGGAMPRGIADVEISDVYGGVGGGGENIS